VTAVTWLSESMVTDVAGTPPNATPVVPVSPLPLMTTLAPPAAGLDAGATLVTEAAVGDPSV
jgi:hypothetical protein